MAIREKKRALFNDIGLPTPIEHILREIVTLKFGEKQLTDLDHYTLPS